LARVAPGTPIVALVYDDEVVEALPVEPHDRLVTVVVTPARVLRF
jgi:5-formyltetrahydrofolate cyclo-ligase